MFLDPSSQTVVTITDVLVWIRELSVIGGIAGVAWKSRGAWDDAKNFLDRIETHMTIMENFAKSTVENHLHHIEKALNVMANIEEDKNDPNQN